MTATSAIIYECGICGHCHPWDWKGDCRDDDNRFTSDEYAARLGIPESDLEIRSMADRCKADGLDFSSETTTCNDCGHDLNGEGTMDGFCWSCDSDRKWGAGDQRCSKCEGPWRRGRCENCDQGHCSKQNVER